jgi:hypothetical protein
MVELMGILSTLKASMEKGSRKIFVGIFAINWYGMSD